MDDLFTDKQDIVLREYQMDAVEKVRNEFLRGLKRVGVQLPTGAGKTILAMYMVQKAIGKGLRVAFVTDQINLARQSFEAADKFGIEYGVIQGNHPKYNLSAPLQVCTIQSLAKKHKDFDMAIIDEYHVAYKAQLEWMANHTKVYFIGLSATPFTKGLGLHWQSLVVGPTTKELINLGHLCDFDAYAPSAPDLSGVKVTGGDYNQGQLSTVMQNRSIYADIISTWLKLAKNQKTIAFCVDIAHAESIADQFSITGISSAAIHSKLSSEEQDEVMRDFKSGRTKILCSVHQIIKGFDEPSAVVALDAAPTKSLARHIQKMGRILRTFPGKDRAIILDHANNLATMGLPTDKLPSKHSMAKKGERAPPAETEEPLPKTCIKCKTIKSPKVVECPCCGHTPERFSDVEILPGELKQMSRTQKKNAQETSIADLVEWYGFFKSFQAKNSFAGRWAEEKFKKKFGFDPETKFGSDVKYAKWNEDHKQWVRNYNMRSQYARGKYGGGQTHKQSPQAANHSSFDKKVQQLMNAGS